MKTFKIATKTNEIAETVPAKYERVFVSGGGLCIETKITDGDDFIVGGKVRFEKYAIGNNDQSVRVCDEDCLITNIVEENGYKYIYFEYPYIKPLTIAAFHKIESPDGYKYKFYFTDDHDMVPIPNKTSGTVRTDFDNKYSGNYVLYVKRGGNILNFGGLALCYPNELVRGKNKITPGDEMCCSPNDIYFNYDTMEKNSILAKTSGLTSGSGYTPEQGDQVILATNAYFFTNSDETVTLFDNVYICKYTDFTNLGVVLEQDYDAKRMFQEYQVNELFVKKIKNSIIPDFIDLEKVKYAPGFYEVKDNEETPDGPSDKIVTLYLATGLTFNLHFRTRVSGSPIEDGTDDEYAREIAKFTFEDTWHLNDATDTWNGNGIQNGDFEVFKQDQLYQDDKFVNSSNLIGYLGFTDDDIYNQKNRVKQTFIRFSFYDSINPLEQSLLYYTTIFLDSGDLFGKYVKRRAWLEDNIEYYDQTLDPVVWSPTGQSGELNYDETSAVTSQLIVNDEYDMTRSGEGFNLYLFREDAPIENYPQDIYMKIEFNHAGYGRTVPLIYWPKDENGVPIKLTTRNYLKYLYIPVKLSFSEKGYVYSFPDTFQVTDDPDTRKNGILWENERIVFNLFEPMITPDNFDE